ncbi:multidrug and toxin extrusion protein 1-like [Scyliorhinus canicula]|uniref:multidrug and toxin extrusion protein 1-like n=1 Tax=Scyliorhinus canicula TaxID=7830 RepID=UPI0018F3CB5A|nr:multidrug and toxin extrusion protein 1-like [Scyliorhinus canicula]
MTDLMQVASSTAPQTPGTCGSLFLRKIRRILPRNFWQEAKDLIRIAGPVFLAQLMIFLINVVSTIFCGHLGKIELDAVSLATAMVNVSGVSVGAGLSLTCDTLISQTFGSKNLKQIGVILQKAILILMIACFPCWAIFINTENILLAFKQSPDVAKLSGSYVMICVPALPAVFLYHLEMRYLQNQGITMPQILTGFIANIFNALVNYLLLNVLALGVQGSAAANVASQYCQAILLFGYIRWKKLHVETWEGWSTDCLQEWGLFIRLAISSMLMLCIEWWSYEIGAFLAGIISDVQLGAQCVLLQILSMVYMVPLGFSVAAAVRVGTALGAGNPEKAQNSAKASLWCIGLCALIIAITLEALSEVVGYIFTTDKEIVQLVGNVFPIVIINQFIDCFTCVNGGVLRGAGMQKLGAVGNLVGFYLIGFPIGISLMFAAKLGIRGFWYGMVVCVFCQFTFYQIVICRMNWNEASNQALINAGVKKDMGPSHSASGGQTENISTEVHPGNIAVIEVGPVENNVGTGHLRGESSGPETIVQEILSVKQLIIRRGLAFLSGPLILAIGLLLKTM